MSILNCNTRLTFVNCTGLEIHIKLCPSKSTASMRVQPLGTAHMRGAIESNASDVWLVASRMVSTGDVRANAQPCRVDFACVNGGKRTF